MRHTCFARHLGIDVPLLGLLAEDKPYGGYAVVEGESVDGDGIVLIDTCRLGADDIYFQILRYLPHEADHLS